MTWTLILCDRNFNSPQAFVVEGEPNAEAQKLKAQQPWLQDYVLIAAVEGRPDLLTRDDAKGLDEWSLS